ncbi:MAG TPA: succinyldiaminopimelate transaminase [Burkholderiales bacterium]|nr:succinyldiaminopimelate transaminase [Burkholderiales bacterium]
MNPHLARLQQYPFQKLAALLKGVQPDPAHRPINLSIGEPKHATPEFIQRALVDNLDGLAGYPPTLGTEALRTSIAAWITRRYDLPAVDPARQVLPLNGSREGLFAIAQAVVDNTRAKARVVMPNPFYQIYEGATLLAGAEPEFINTLPGDGYRLDLDQLPASVWAQTQLIYVCSPNNPTGSVLGMADWERLFALSDQYGFVIASDECYSEIYFDEASPPLGGLQAAHRLGRDGYPRLICFGSLSKRSNVPGMRSGFVAGDAALLEKFLLFRTYLGNAMSLTVQAASRVAWEDEAHVRDNRRLYRQKFDAAIAVLRDAVPVVMPQGAFYLWLPTPTEDTDFARRLYQTYNVVVLPGSYLAREARRTNPGRGFVRAALVSTPAECDEAMRRIRAFLTRHA